MPKPKNRSKILVAALDWGLGHAARCIPVVRELQAQGAEVWLAGSGQSLTLLRNEFPDLPFLELPAYNIRYAHKNMIRSLGSQAFKILRTIVAEHFALRKFVRRQGIDAVISDCRFGCFTRRATCVFITHQLHIRTPNAWLSKVVNAFNRWFIRRYDALWIPDLAAGGGLAGALSHPPLPGGRYIGLLSRMKRLEVPERYDVVAVLSGPEPQRTILEELILEQAKGLAVRLLLVRGKIELISPSPSPSLPLPPSPYLSLPPSPFLKQGLPTEVGDHMSAAKLILSRSGYSTLMDLARIGKPAILIPTPGQTEQEYLAEYWSDKGAFSVWTQETFDLKKALEEAANLKGLDPALFPEGGLSEAVKNLIGPRLGQKIFCPNERQRRQLFGKKARNVE